MSRPGTDVRVSDVLPPASAPTSTDVLFAIGEAARGPSNVPASIRSYDSLTERFGGRINPPGLHDAVESFFRDGGVRAYVLRLVDGAVAASADAGTFTATARDVGAVGDGLVLDVVSAARAAAPARRGPRLTLASGAARSRAGVRVVAVGGVVAGRATVGVEVEIEVTDDDGDVIGVEDLDAVSWGDGTDSTPATLTHTYEAAAASVTILATHGDESGGLTIAVAEVGVEEDELLAAVVTLDGKVVERSAPRLRTVGDLVEWAADSDYVEIAADDETVELAVGSHQFSGGDDGTVPVRDPYALLDTAMRFPAALGPGQLVAPGKVDAAEHEALLRAAESGNRCAILDADPTLDEPGLAAHVRTLRSTDVARFGGLFAPRAVVPGRAAGTRRIAPWSGVQSALIARLDQLGNPNRAAAGQFGQSRWAVSLERQFSDDERERLMHAGVNTARVIYNTVRGYGFRSLVDENGPDRGWLLLSNVRLAMAIKARADATAERYVFELIDGRGKTLSRFGSELAGICLDYWPDALYGDTPEEAFRVETGDGVNTPESIADGQIRAVILLRMAPFGEWVEVQVVKQAITEPLLAAA